jgi:excinuclease ABC subunit C
MDKIKEKLSLLPLLPGCYLMKNKDGNIIYVGKAKKLKNRVTSYFRGTHTGKTARLVSEIDDFEYITVNTEMESLILENNLIKKYNPKYNILLKDDKTYPYIELTDEKVFRLRIIRTLTRSRKQKHLYGPYPNVTAARNVVNLINRMYPIRKCNTYEDKPCLYYHIGQCLGYCYYDIEEEKINNMKDEIIKFLNGDHSIVTDKINKEIKTYSDNLEFEKALELKQLLDYINVTLTHQQVETKDMVDRDVFGYYIDKGYLSIQVFFIRGAKIVERYSKIIPLIDEVDSVLTSFIANFYSNKVTPREILVPDVVSEQVLSEYLETSVHIPQKGDKKRLVELANENASIALNENFELIKRDEAKTIDANEELRELLGLEKLDRIEIFDNAHLFGTYNVSGMVVYIDGKPAKNEYRKFKISVDKNDDYGTMREVIYRRYFRVLRDDLVRPDIIIVDGGLGQINVAEDVIKSLGLNIPVVGLKKDDRHATNKLLTTEKEYDINRRSNLFYLLERMQDDVHEFTINYHKQLRSKGSLSSILDEVEGIGTKRKKELLKKYRTITKMKEASIEELKDILPDAVAQNFYDFLQAYKEM